MRPQRPVVFAKSASAFRQTGRSHASRRTDWASARETGAVLPQAALRACQKAGRADDEIFPAAGCLGRFVESPTSAAVRPARPGLPFCGQAARFPKKLPSLRNPQSQSPNGVHRRWPAARNARDFTISPLTTPSCLKSAEARRLRGSLPHPCRLSALRRPEASAAGVAPSAGYVGPGQRFGARPLRFSLCVSVHFCIRKRCLLP